MSLLRTLAVVVAVSSVAHASQASQVPGEVVIKFPRLRGSSSSMIVPMAPQAANTGAADVVPDATQSDDSSQVDSSTQKSTDYAVNSAGMETEGDAPVLSDAMSFYQSRWQKEQEEEEPPGEEITDDRDDPHPSNLTADLVQSMIDRATQKLRVLDQQFVLNQKEVVHDQSNSESWQEASDLLESAKQDLVEYATPEEHTAKRLFDAYKEAETALSDVERLGKSMNVAIVVG